MCVWGGRGGGGGVMGWRGVKVRDVWRGEEVLRDSKGSKW